MDKSKDHSSMETLLAIKLKRHKGQIYSIQLQTIEITGAIAVLASQDQWFKVWSLLKHQSVNGSGKSTSKQVQSTMCFAAMLTAVSLKEELQISFLMKIDKKKKKQILILERAMLQSDVCHCTVLLLGLECR